MPVDPGGTAQVPVQETIAIQSQLKHENAEALHIHYNHNDMDATLKTIALKEVDSTYIFLYITYLRDTWGY